MATSQSSVVRVGDCQLNLRTGEVLRNGIPIRLQPQPAKVLGVLVSRAGELVSREELQQAIWGDETFVDFEARLNACVKQIRQVLGDNAEAPSYIETLPRLGYRLIAWTRPAPHRDRVMLLVLPFENLGGDPDQDYFSDGLTEEMISVVGKLQPEALGVIARTTAMQYKDTHKRIDQIGQELGVEYVLEGSVRRQGSLVRVNAQLARVRDQSPLWAESYDREFTDVLSLQDEIAVKVASSLPLELLPPHEQRLAGKRSVNPQAYEAYLKAAYFQNKFTHHGLRKSVEYHEEAIRLDPSFPLPYIGLSVSYAMLAATGALPPREAFARGKMALEKAKKLDPGLSELRSELGFYHFLYDWDWSAAEKEFQRALALDPNSANARFGYGHFLMAMGRFRQAEEEMERARKLDPLSLKINAEVGNTLFLARKYKEAETQLQKTLELDPSFPAAHFYLCNLYAATGRQEEAIASSLELVKAVGTPSAEVPPIEQALAMAGWKEASRRQIDCLLAWRAKTGPVGAYVVAMFYNRIGETDQAIVWLERAYEERHHLMAFLQVDPAWASLHEDPRFQDLLRRMNFPK